MKKPSDNGLNDNVFSMLRQNWVKDKAMTESQANRLVNALADIDTKCQQLRILLHDEIGPATQQEDYAKVANALTRYDLFLWEIRAFRYLSKARRIIGRVNARLYAKYSFDDVEESPSSLEEA